MTECIGEPKAGDVIRLDGYYYAAEPGARAVIDGGEHYGPGVAMAVFRPSAFRGESSLLHCLMDGDSTGVTPTVSVSGGPCPRIRFEDLEFVGTTEQRFWRWKDRPRAGGGEDYIATVNLWSWKGETPPATSANPKES